MFNYLKFIRTRNFPHIWCPGCGDGIILKALIRAIDGLDISRDEAVMVSGIGCSSRTPGYVDINTLHTTHGRALPFATGVKHASPDLNVIVVTGDGDATAIGGNHYIHAARRNINLTVLLYNNYIYGMTGGQCSPTTPRGDRASTAPYGNIEPPFNTAGLAISAGASFVARADVYNVKRCEKMIRQALEKDGFSLVEILTPCPTAYGRRNRMANPVKLMEWLRDNTVPVQKWEKLSPEEREGKVRVGVLADTEKPEFTAEYRKLIERVQGE
ncbi:MAG: 2-oxoacid:ferredoxin oxidoreductase subunit beta [Candidatus Latescibacteria bacterium]|nr:2-oxoacid:ferredoxin oxidoreductase subunit beta [bacterium]MBD3424735.1 2-oxoacid:ferredoxin oxidoreductase subunit beta [Candidatus Latescibacterota bacterium]